MEIIYTVLKLLFFKSTDLYTMDTKIWLHVLSSWKQLLKELSKYIFRELNYHQHKIRREISISVEIITNTFKCLTASFSVKTFTLAIASLFIILVSILCKFALVADVFILLLNQEEKVHSSFWRDRCAHLAAHSWKRLNSLSAIILVGLDDKSKRQDCKITTLPLVLLV